jgi:exodeoxyribonuclease VII large subunit
LKMPLLPKRIAIISVQTSKGYSDFIQTIEKNPWGYRFFHLLFPAILQGERAVDSIVSQLVRIRKVLQHFDAVAIIRGGGGEVGLTCYNNYALSREIALFPIPVITGIGHSTNETVAEMIAFKNAITPTDLADYLLQQFHNYSVPVQNAIEALIGLSGRMIREEKVKWRHSVKYFKSVTGSLLIGRHHEIRNSIRALRQQSRLQMQVRQQNVQRSKEKLFSRIDAYLITEKKEIRYLEKNIGWLDPENILRRGYSITLKDGQVVKAAEEVRKGDTLTTLLAGGKITSSVTSDTTTHPPTN